MRDECQANDRDAAAEDHDASAGREPVILGEQSQRRIGSHLRTLYDSILQQPVPDRFRELIEKLGTLDEPHKTR